MVNFTFHLAKSVEFVSRHVGAGPFEVNPHFRCSTCAASESAPLCAECQSAWVTELSVLSYSDAFERRLNAAAGSASLVLALASALVNSSLGIWEEGVVVGWLTSHLALLTTFLSPSMITALTPFYLTALFIVTLLSLFSLSANLLVASFIMAMNPTGARHWRNMNVGVYAVIALQMVLVMVVVYAGVMAPPELIFVGCPVLMGIGALGCAVCIGCGGEERVFLGEAVEEEARVGGKVVIGVKGESV